ncbi:MAG: integrase family protein [Candidatus Eremiobacteraeota bacterium]|nr:integrase family protein [Candidatus Eremiobacteraeota bacterium]
MNTKVGERAGKPAKRRRERRPRGDGTIYQRASDGRWVGRVKVNGKTVTVYAADAKAAADKLRVARVRATKIPRNFLTIDTWLEQWLDEAERDGQYSGGTAGLYRGTVSKHISPAMGSSRLVTVSAESVRDLMGDLDAAKVSAGVRKRVHTILRQGLLEAYRRELVSENVTDRVRAPKVRTGRRHGVGLEIALDFLAAARGDRNEGLYLALMANGLREGEAFGLKPGDVDLDAGTVRIARQLQERKGGLFETLPKGGKIATIPLAPILHEPLRVLLEERAKKKKPAVPYLFTSEKGRALRRSVFLRKVWHPFCKTHKLPYMVPHQFRHTTATLLKVLGVPVEVAREILRHASIETTASVYQDEIPALQRDALGKLSDLLGSRAAANGAPSASANGHAANRSPRAPRLSRRYEGVKARRNGSTGRGVSPAETAP